MIPQPKEKLVEIYDAAVVTYLTGVCRLVGAEAAYSRINVALTELPQAPTDGSEEPIPIEQLRLIKPGTVDAYRYLTEISLLVYATTLFDTFLNETTRFLLLLHPAAMGKDETITLSAVLGASSVSSVVNSAIDKKVRELGFPSFLDRIDYLRKRFGLKIALSDATIASLAESSDLRNHLVHDQGFLEMSLGDDGAIKVRQARCSHHPIHVAWQHSKKARETYDQIVAEVYRVVTHDVLKAGHMDRVVAQLHALLPNTHS